MDEERPGDATPLDDEADLLEAVEVEEGEAEAAGDAVQAELERLQDETDHLRELYKSKLADFDNYRKRRDKEMSDFRKFAAGELVRDLLPVVDNLERALGAGSTDAAGLHAGVELTLRQFRDVLSKYGVTEIDPLGSPFDPAFHEAVSRLATVEAEPNTVVQVLQKGYRINDRLLRAALVVVAAPPPKAAEPPASEVEP